jgi:spermidine synthase
VGAWFLARAGLGDVGPAATADLHSDGAPAESRGKFAKNLGPSPKLTPFVYVAAGIVGFCFFLMELIWYRMLGPILGGTTFTFGLILGVALLGIGLGGAAYAILPRRRRPTLLGFAATCGLEAACIAVPFALGDQLALLAADYYLGASTFLDQLLGWTVVAMIVVGPASVISGYQFPLLVSLAGEADRDLGKQVGLTLGSNTLGAIAGCLAGGFGLLPLLTAPGAWAVVVGLLVALACVSLLLAFRREKQKVLWRFALPTVACLAAVTCVASDGPTAAWRHSGIGAGRFQIPVEDPNARRDWLHAKRRRVLWEAEGVEASIALVADNGLSFYINGKSDGNAIGDAGTQVMSLVFGALLHPEAQTGLVIGLGTGETAGWLAEVPTIKCVDVVELEPAIDEMARQCSSVNHDVLNHPKVHRIYNDAREVLLTTDNTYDLVFSEPSNPYRAGIASLFTREFYMACQDRLASDGLFIQWVQGYEIDETTVRTIFATLLSVFGHVEVWQSKPEDMLLVCSRESRRLAPDALRERIAREPFRSALACGWQVTDLEGFFSRFVAGPKLVDQWARQEGVRVNTDNHNVIEYGFARTVGRDSAGFSIPSLRQYAFALAAHRPELVEGEVDWGRVEGHRQVLYSLCNQQVDLPLHSTVEQRARRKVLDRYWQTDTTGMVAVWEAAGYEPIFPTETALLALAYADIGSDRAKELASKLRSYRPVEADAIEAYLYRRQGKTELAAEALKRTLHELRVSPWGLSHVLELTFDVAVDVARLDPSQAIGIFQALSKPFAVYAYEERRLLAAHIVATRVGPSAVVETLQAFEPHVPWNEEFLANRLRIYAATEHPLRERARKDLAVFRKYANAPTPQAR